MLQTMDAIQTPVKPARGSIIARRLALLVFCLCSIAMVAEGFDTYAVGYVGPALAKAWGLNQAVVGQMYAVGVAASLFGSMALGALSDWFGRKWLLVGATVVFGLATIGSAMSPNFEALIVSRILAGLGLGASIPCAMALATERASARYKATVPVFICACIGFGVVVAGLAAAWVMPLYGWRGLMAVGAIFPIMVAALSALLLPRSAKGAVAPIGGERQGRWRTLAEPRMALIAGAVTLGLIATYTVTFFFGFWLPTLLSGAAHDIRTIGLASALIKTFSVFGSLALGRLMDRFGGGRVLPWAFVAAGLVLFLAIGETHELPRLILSLGVASFFLDGAFGGIVGFGALVFPDQVRGTGIGFTIGLGRLIGGVLGPLLGGALFSLGLSVKLICAVFAGPLLIAALMVVVASRLAGKRAASGAASKSV